MANLEGWDWALLVVAGYVAVMSLVRLMRGHRDAVLGQFREQIEKQRSGPQSRPAQGGPSEPGTTDDRRKAEVA